MIDPNDALAQVGGFARSRRSLLFDTSKLSRLRGMPVLRRVGLDSRLALYEDEFPDHQGR